MIRRLSIENFKALRSVNLELTPIHAFIGRNDSGKSTILEAVHALCRSVRYPLADAFTGPWEGRDLVWNRLDEWVKFSVQVEGSGNTPMDYNLACTFGAAGRHVRVADERLSCPNAPDPDNRTVNLPGAVEDSTGIREAYHSSSSERGKASAGVSLLRNALTPVHFYRLTPSFLSLPVALNPDRRYRMEPSGFGLASLLDDVLGGYRSQFDKINQALGEFFPNVEDILLKQSEGYDSPPDSRASVPVLRTASGKRIYYKLAGIDEPIPAGQASDGLNFVLAFLTLLHLHPSERPRVLLIEEPENGIHHGLLEKVVNLFRETRPDSYRTQILMTTHSPYLLDYLEPEEVTFCDKNVDGSVRVRRLSDSPRISKERVYFSLGEAWTAMDEESLFDEIPEESPSR